MLSPAVAATVVTPVAPMSGIDRSFILGPADERLQFSIGDGDQAGRRSRSTARSSPMSASGSGRDRSGSCSERSQRRATRHRAGTRRKGRMKLSLLDLPVASWISCSTSFPPDIRARFKARTAHKRPSLGLGPGPLAVPEGDPVVGLDARGDDVELDDQVVDGSTADGDATGALDEGAALDDMATRGGAAPDLEDASDPDDIDRASHAHVPS